jgi:hypothetical protein
MEGREECMSREERMAVYGERMEEAGRRRKGEGGIGK